MTRDDVTPEAEPVRTLRELVEDRVRQHGWSDLTLERRSGGVVSDSTWHWYQKGNRLKRLPDASSLLAIANALDVDVTTVVLAAARSAGLPVRAQGTRLAQMLPAGTELLSADECDAIVTVARVLVANAMDREVSTEVDRGHGSTPTGTTRWPRQNAPTRRRNEPPSTDESRGIN